MSKLLIVSYITMMEILDTNRWKQKQIPPSSSCHASRLTHHSDYHSTKPSGHLWSRPSALRHKLVPKVFLSPSPFCQPHPVCLLPLSCFDKAATDRSARGLKFADSHTAACQLTHGSQQELYKCSYQGKQWAGRAMKRGNTSVPSLLHSAAKYTGKHNKTTFNNTYR